MPRNRATVDWVPAGDVNSYRTDVRKPYFTEDGRAMVTINLNYGTGKRAKFRAMTLNEAVRHGFYDPVFNATSLRKEEWVKLDTEVIKAARLRLRAWSDLEAANVVSFDGWGKYIFESETQSDVGEALVDMDTLSEDRNHAPLYKLQGIPLPITHAGFMFSKRQLEASRNSGTPLDTTLAEMAGRRVAEMIEKTLIGVETGMTYGGANTLSYERASKIYGYTNFPPRITKTNLTVPTGSNPEATVSDILAMRDLMYANKHFGPFIIYHSTDWDKYLDNDYARLGGNNANQTLRNRLKEIEDISDIRRLDYLSSSTNPWTLIMVSMTKETARAIKGMELTTVQWDSRGGLQTNFRVMAIMVPQLRADYDGNCGILHATAA